MTPTNPANQSSRLIFFVFPYLKTTGSYTYRGIQLHSSRNLAALPSHIAQHLAQLSAMFYLSNTAAVDQMSCGYFEATDRASLVRVLTILGELQTILSYFYSAPDIHSGSPFLYQEHASLFIFEEDDVVPSLALGFDTNDSSVSQSSPHDPQTFRTIRGYSGMMNRRVHLSVVPGSRIYPPVPQLWLNLSQDIADDLNHRLRASTQWPVQTFFSIPADEPLPPVGTRVLTAMQWYNRTLSFDTDDEMALVHLAIAFESLLGLPNTEKVTDRFQQAVLLLLGPVPRLDSWLAQFYKARSELVHEGRSSNLIFKAGNLRKQAPVDGPPYRSLVMYGRHIFRASVVTLLTGAHVAERLSLSSMLVTNQQRFEEICRVLDATTSSPQSRLRDIRQHVVDVEEYRFVQDVSLNLDTLIGAADRVAQTYLATSPNDSPVLITALQALATRSNSMTQYHALECIRELDDAFDHSQQPPTQRPEDAARAITASLIKTVWGLTFIKYFQLQSAQPPASSPATSTHPS